MQVALLLDQGDRRVVPADGLLPELLDTPEFERREVITGQVSDEVRGTDDERSVLGELHIGTVAAGRATSSVAAAPLRCGDESQHRDAEGRREWAMAQAPGSRPWRVTAVMPVTAAMPGTAVMPDPRVPDARRSR